MPDDPDFERDGFLEGLSDQARAERVELLRWLADQGFTPEELAWGHRHGVLAFLAAGREIGGARQYTPEQVAAESGVDLDFLMRVRRAQGLPTPEHDEAAFSELDLQVSGGLAAWITHGFEPDGLISTTREIGSSIARAAEAMRSALFDLIVAPGATERELAETYATTAARLLPLADQLVVGLTRQHLRNIMQTELAGAVELAAGRSTGALDLAVGFADLVGFTRLGEELPPEELGRVAEQLVEIVQELVAPPVRMVKTIGDAVMLTSPDPVPLIDFGLRLCERVAERGPETPQLRVGIASGPVVARAGDVFGGPVNVASRVTGVARAGSVLTTAPVREAAGDEFAWSLAGVRRLKGLPRPLPLFRPRPRTS